MYIGLLWHNRPPRSKTQTGDISEAQFAYQVDFRQDKETFRPGAMECSVIEARVA